MVRIRKILLVVVSVLVGIFFILPLIGVGILKWAVLPPEKLTPLVVEKTNEFIAITMAHTLVMKRLCCATVV